jgi:hypothetical protein
MLPDVPRDTLRTPSDGGRRHGYHTTGQLSKGGEEKLLFPDDTQKNARNPYLSSRMRLEEKAFFQLGDTVFQTFLSPATISDAFYGHR